MPNGSADFVLTDPPYLVGYGGRWDEIRRSIVGDDDPVWFRPAFTELWRVLKQDAFAVSFYGWPHADIFAGGFKAIGFRLVSHLDFVKNVWGLGRFTRGQHETAYLLAKGHPPVPDAPVGDVFDWVREAVTVHPNQKPVGPTAPTHFDLRPTGWDRARSVHGLREHATGGEGCREKSDRNRDRTTLLSPCRVAAASGDALSGVR